MVLGDDPASGEHLHLIDFGAYRRPGENFRLVVGAARSRPFRIAADLFARLPPRCAQLFLPEPGEHPDRGALRRRRALGAARGPRAGPRHLHLRARTSAATIWAPCPYTLDVSRRLVRCRRPGEICRQWRHRRLDPARSLRARPGRAAGPSSPTAAPSLPEAGNGVSDLLDEARWEVEFLLAMQVPQGTRMRLPVGPLRPGAPPPFQRGRRLGNGASQGRRPALDAAADAAAARPRDPLSLPAEHRRDAQSRRGRRAMRPDLARDRRRLRGPLPRRGARALMPRRSAIPSSSISAISPAAAAISTPTSATNFTGPRRNCSSPPASPLMRRTCAPRPISPKR